jgi:SecD/SecF fusion protein
MTSLSPRPSSSLLRRHLWKILLTLGLVGWAVFELIPLRTIPFADYARQHATVQPAEFEKLLDEAAARIGRSQAPSEYIALQQIGRERKLDLSHYFPRIRLEETLQNVERRNDLVLGELARQSRGRVQRGLDLAGGVAITLEIDERAAGADDPDARKEKIKKAIEIIAKRIDARGIAEPIIRPVGNNRIEVQLPDVNIRDNPDLVAQVKKPARLDFRLVHPTLQPGPGGDVPPGYEVLALEVDGRGSETSVEELFIKIMPEFSGNLVAEARAQTDSLGRSEVIMDLTQEGTVRFAELTSRITAKGTQTGRLAIVLDGKLQSAPLVKEEIRNGIATIRGGRMSDREAIDLANVLNNPLDLPLVVKEQHEVGPSLAQAAVDAGVRAAIIGTSLVAAFMITFYATGGLVAVFTLGINLLIILGVMASLGATITLPGLAGIVLTVGMAVDANILIFERMREELAAGGSLTSANTGGYRKALTTIIDAHLVQLIICGIMIWLGSGPIKGFGVTLLIGVLSTLFSVLITAHLVMELLIDSGTLRKITLRRMLPDFRFDFIKFGRPAFIASWLVVVLGVAVIIQKGAQIYGPDFTGGDVVSVQFNQPPPSELAIREAAAAGGVKPVNITTARIAGRARETIKLETPEEKGALVFDALQKAFPQSGLEHLGQTHVGAAIGRETQLNALLAVGVSMLTILLYIAFRFEFGYGVGAVVATLHDILMTIGIFVLTGRQFNAPMVAAILCIAGYSINETVVVFDRIREELKLNPSGTLRDVVNGAIRKVFARTIMTASTTFLAALALFVFGGGVLRDISFTFLVGILTSTFSAIFVAAQVFYWWHNGDRERVEGDESDLAPRRPWERPSNSPTKSPMAPLSLPPAS